MTDRALAAETSLTLEEIRTKAQKRFPVQLLEGQESALCLFGAGSLGRCDLIRLLDASIADVSVVDPSKSKMEEVKKIFPASWQYLPEDCLEACRRLVDEERHFDIVICDGSSGVVDHIWESLLPYIHDLASNAAIVKINGEYLSLQDVEHKMDGVADLVAHFHYARIRLDDLILRSNGKGGTYWAVFSRRESDQTMVRSAGTPPFRSGLGTSTFEEIRNGQEKCVLVSDNWDSPACSKLDSCKDSINRFRKVILQKQSQSMFRVYTPSSFSRLPEKLIDQNRFAGACFDLARYEDISDVMNAAKGATTKRGNTNRAYMKAKRLGFYLKSFNPKTFVVDLQSIHVSLSDRGGKAMRSPYLKSIEEMGGLPQEKYEPKPELCPLHGQRMWGVFREEPGYLQGDVVTHERLVAYIHLYFFGNHCWYSRIMGHGDYLRDGVMLLLHFDLIEELMKSRRQEGVRSVFYGAMASGKTESLSRWKRVALFEPKYLIYSDAGDWSRGMHFL